MMSRKCRKCRVLEFEAANLFCIPATYIHTEISHSKFTLQSCNFINFTSTLIIIELCHSQVTSPYIWQLLGTVYNISTTFGNTLQHLTTSNIIMVWFSSLLFLKFLMGKFSKINFGMSNTNLGQH